MLTTLACRGTHASVPGSRFSPRRGGDIPEIEATHDETLRGAPSLASISDSLFSSDFDRLYSVGAVGQGAHVLQGENLFDITINQAARRRNIAVLRIDDVGVRHFGAGWVELDVRLRNAGSGTANLTHLDLHVLERHNAMAVIPPSATYELMLHPCLPHNLIRIAHVLEPGDVDRVLVRVGNKWGPQLIEAEILVHFNGSRSAASNPIAFETNPKDHIVFGAKPKDRLLQGLASLFARRTPEPRMNRSKEEDQNRRWTVEWDQIKTQGVLDLEQGVAGYTRDQLAFLGVQSAQFAALADRWRRRQERYARAKSSGSLPLAELKIVGVRPAQFGPVS